MLLFFKVRTCWLYTRFSVHNFLVVASVKDCQALLYVVGISLGFGFASTGALMYLRVRAVLAGQTRMVTFFTVLWRIDAAICIVIPFGMTGAHIGPTHACINTSVKPFELAPVVMGSLHDTLIFLAISWKLAVSYEGDMRTSRATLFWRGNHLPRLSQILLRSGQKYYL